MKAVFSLWTEPMGGSLNPSWKSNWYDVESHLCGWVKAFYHTKEFFDKVDLVTDDAGALLLSDKIGIPFDSITTELNDMSRVPKGIWAAGKIKAYQVQSEPFFHIDADCFLYKALPEEWLNAPVAAQNIEDGGWFNGSYVPEILHAENVLPNLPPIWRKAEYAPCMGIFAAHDLDFVESYCKNSLDMMENIENKEAWNSISNQGSYSIIVEQYLAACQAEVHNTKFRWLCPDGGIDKEYLEKLGYCHLWGAKKDENVAAKLKQITSKDYSAEFSRIQTAIGHLINN